MRIGWLLFVLAFFGIGCDSTVKRGETPEPTVGRSDSAVAAKPAPERQPQDEYHVVTRRIDEKNTAPLYEIALEYPAINGARMHTSWEHFNHMIADTVAAMVGGFKQDQAELEPVEGDAGLGSSMHSSFEVALSTPDLISLLMVMDEYQAGAAHPMGGLQGFTYDLANDRPVALRNLFLPKSGYLDTLSTKAIEQLTMQLGENADLEMLRSGAAAAEENFENFTLGRDSLVIDFGEYQIGPYALGRQRIAIAYNSLSTILSPDGPVARLGTAR